MDGGVRHRWDVAPREAVALQRELARQVRVEPLRRPVRLVAGADCAFPRGTGRIVAAAVLCDARTLEVIASAHLARPCEFPYVPGLLSFREAPALIEAVRALPSRPDLLMCDGQGPAHPRRLGLASHVGLWLDLPTIGVAKSRLCGRHRPVGQTRRCQVRLRDGHELIGAVVRTRTAVKPVYVSVGHRIDLAGAVHWVLRCARRYRLPEPTRQADLMVRALSRRRAEG